MYEQTTQNHAVHYKTIIDNIRHGNVRPDKTRQANTKLDNTKEYKTMQDYIRCHMIEIISYTKADNIRPDETINDNIIYY